MIGPMLAGLVLVPAVLANPAMLTVSPADVQLAEKWVAQLGDPKYTTREQASRELAALGRRAIGPLTAARRSPVPEIRARAEALHPAAVSADQEARLAIFLLDVQGQFEHDLPGWSAFQQLAGRDTAARKLFADLASDAENTPLLAAFDGDGAATSAALAVKRAQVIATLNRPQSNRQQSPVLTDMAALLFAEAVTGEDAPGGPFQYNVGNFLTAPAGVDTLNGRGEHGAAMQRLATAWLESRQSETGASVAVSVLVRAGQPSATVCRFAARMLDTPGGQPFNRARACTYLIQHKGVAYLPKLVATMSDETPVTRATPGQPPPPQVGDVALVAALILTNQSPTDYGFTVFGNPSRGVQYQSYTFQDDPPGGPDVTPRTLIEKRQAAQARWAAWAEAARATLGGLGLAAADPKPAPAPGAALPVGQAPR